MASAAEDVASERTEAEETLNRWAEESEAAGRVAAEPV